MVDYTLVPVNNRYQFDNGELVWAEADVHQAARYLKRLKDDPEWRAETGRAGQKVIRERVTTAQCGERIRKRTEEILGRKL
jgi:glycosyltransferase involved in cell wall biosynthesis